MYQILIVDDEKMIRLGIKKSMPWETMGISRVHTAASAKEALILIQDHHPQIIVTDISMTEMNGLELIERLKENNETSRIIVLTGYDRFDYARQALLLRVQDFLLKPIDEKELKDCIQRQINDLEEEKRKKEEAERIRRTRGVYQQTQLEMWMGEYLKGNDIGQQEEIFLKSYPCLAEQKMRIGILVPSMSSANSGDHESFRIQTIKNVCMSVLDEQRKGITFSDSSGRIITALYGEGMGAESTELAGRLVELLESECSIKVRIVLGSEQAGVRSLHISYNDAVFTLEHQNESFENIVKSQWEQKRDHMFRESCQEFQQAILSNIHHADQVMHIFDRFLQCMESYNLSNRFAARCCFELAAAVYFVYVNESGDGADDRLDTLMKVLNGTDREKAGRLTAGFLQKLLTKEQGEEHELVRKVKNRIHENLAQDLSVSSLAEEVYVTANYLSRIFKRMTGEGCNEYIVRKRIEKARSLLETSTLKMGEIADIVGYHDINYFSLAFKKHMGMSPSKYREDVQGKRT